MSKTILVVEDYADVRHFMKLLVESYGYQVTEAADGLEAIESMREPFPDLILMDISMPRMDGLAATKAIRKLASASEIPIIAVSAFGNQYYERAIDAGCNTLINKPVDFENIKLLLNQYLSQ